MRLEEMNELFLLQQKIEELRDEFNCIKLNLKEVVLEYIRKKIKIRDFNIVSLEFEIRDGIEEEYNEIDCRLHFKIDDFDLYINNDEFSVEYKSVTIIKYEYDFELDVLIRDLITEISEVYGIRKFEYNGNLNKLYSKLKRKEEEYEKIKNLLQELE